MKSPPVMTLCHGKQAPPVLTEQSRPGQAAAAGTNEGIMGVMFISTATACHCFALRESRPRLSVMSPCAETTGKNCFLRIVSTLL